MATAVTTTMSHNPDTSTTATTTASTAIGSTEKPPPFLNPPFNAVSADYMTIADPFSGDGLCVPTGWAFVRRWPLQPLAAVGTCTSLPPS
jgi:hypothetical protein